MKKVLKEVFWAFGHLDRHARRLVRNFRKNARRTKTVNPSKRFPGGGPAARGD